MKRVTVFAPATVANVAVGFDLLGFPIDGVGDQVELLKLDRPGVEIVKIEGADNLPLQPEKNTATVGLITLLREMNLNFGFQVRLTKGIPLSSGMGGSAASSVAALVAANRFLPKALSKDQLLKFALMGEALASGSAHADNVSPCLFGGLTLTRPGEPLRVVPIPVPREILCVLVHPHLELETRASRGVLRTEISLKDHVRQSANLAGVISGCFLGDRKLIRESLSDLIIEPQRAPLVNGFMAVKVAAMKAGAMGCSLSGSGPSLFAWAESETEAKAIREAMVLAFRNAGVESDAWVAPISPEGARVIAEE